MYIFLFVVAYLQTLGSMWGCICCHLGGHNTTIFGSPTASYTRWLEPPKPIQKSLQLVLLDISLKSLRNLGCLIVCILFTQDKLVLDEWRLQHFLVAESRHTKLSKKLRVSPWSLGMLHLHKEGVKVDGGLPKSVHNKLIAMVLFHQTSTYIQLLVFERHIIL